MRLLDAAELFVEIVMKCRKLDGASFMFTPPVPQVTLAQGYKIHIGTVSGIDHETVGCVENLVKKRGLSLFEDSRGVMIYRKH